MNNRKDNLNLNYLVEDQIKALKDYKNASKKLFGNYALNNSKIVYNLKKQL